MIENLWSEPDCVDYLLKQTNRQIKCFSENFSKTQRIQPSIQNCLRRKNQDNVTHFQGKSLSRDASHEITQMLELSDIKATIIIMLHEVKINTLEQKDRSSEQRNKF